MLRKARRVDLLRVDLPVALLLAVDLLLEESSQRKRFTRIALVVSLLARTNEEANLLLLRSIWGFDVISMKNTAAGTVCFE